MENNKVKLDKIGHWSLEKLNMLGEYLAAYVNILSTDKVKQNCSEFHYIDAFAGAARHLDKETNEYIDGSPLVALKTLPPFKSFTFIEKDHGKIKNVLEPLKNKFPEKDIRILSGDCNKILLENILPEFPPRKYGVPSKLGFIFLDPYGMNLEWKTVEAIGKARVFDVLINLSVMGVTRLASGAQHPSDEDKEKISNLMGGDEWFDICYKANEWGALPGITCNPYVRLHDNVCEKLAKCYAKKLEGNNLFRSGIPFKIMRSSKNSPIYALLFASQAKLALEKMRAIFKKKQ
jgi:three-Cys-motif partner protein